MYRHHRQHSRSRRTLIFEPVEDRRLLTEFVVISTADAGPGTLRKAIEDANASRGADQILFNIAANDSGHWYYQDDGVAGQVSLDKVASTTQTDDANIGDRDTDWPHSWYSLVPQSRLPTIRDTVVINGYTQPGSSENTLPAGLGLDTVPRIELNGEVAGALPNGILHVVAGDSVIKGLAINRVQGPIIRFESVDNSIGGGRVEGNFLGVDISGSTSSEPPPSAAQRYDGVHVRGGSDIVIGGKTPPTRNLISGMNHDSSSGVFIEGTLASRHAVQGNLIGTSRDGTRAIGNNEGVAIASNGGHTVGGPDSQDGNVISANTTGILVRGRNIVIANNWIGTTASGAAEVGNRGVGILVQSNVSGSRIVENTVAFNGSDPPSGGLSGTTRAAGIRVLGALFPSQDSPEQYIGVFAG